MIDKLQLLRDHAEDFENGEEGKGQLADTFELIADIFEAHFQRHDDQQGTPEAAGGLSQVPEPAAVDDCCAASPARPLFASGMSNCVI